MANRKIEIHGWDSITMQLFFLKIATQHIICRKPDMGFTNNITAKQKRQKNKTKHTKKGEKRKIVIDSTLKEHVEVKGQ